jgi:ABC-type lipoprotein release transport system permease subunit
VKTARIAWRNLWRNPRRTLITAFAMAFGMAMMVFTVALLQGFKGQMERYATILGPGHVQLHHPRYLEEHSLYESFAGPEQTSAAAEAALGAAGYNGLAAPRAFATALVSSGSRSAGAQVWGIDPAREAKVTELHRHLAEGGFLAPGRRGELVIGTGLARTLGVKPGDEVVVLTQAADGSLGNALYTVRGVLLPLGEAMDRGGVLMDLSDLDELAALGGRAHEVAVRLPDPAMPEDAAAALKAAAGPLAGLDVRTWKQAMPEISETIRLYDVSQFITLLIIYAAAALIIMDSQLMALFERTREIGVLRALGMGPVPVGMLVLWETVFVSLISLATGAAGGALLSSTMRNGWDISKAGGSFSFSGVVFEPVLRTELTWSSFVQPAQVMLLVALLAAVYPVIRAVRITPMAAIREAGK